MKQGFWILLLMVTIFSCKEGFNHPPEVKVLKTGKPYPLQPGGHNIEIVVNEIQDSRCPMNAICFWPGYAQVFFEIRADSETIKDSLSIPEYRKLGQYSHKYYDLDGVRYGLTLTEVVPYPCHNCPITPKEQRAVFRIFRY